MLQRRNVLMVSCTLFAACAVTGCSSTAVVSSPISAFDGVRMEVYSFSTESGQPEQATRYAVTDRSKIAEVTDYLLRSKGTKVSSPKSESGLRYEAFVISLRDGSQLKALHATKNPKSNWIWTEETGWVDVTTGGDFVDEELVRGAVATAVPVKDVPMADQRGA